MTRMCVRLRTRVRVCEVVGYVVLLLDKSLNRRRLVVRTTRTGMHRVALRMTIRHLAPLC